MLQIIAIRAIIFIMCNNITYTLPIGFVYLDEIDKSYSDTYFDFEVE
jgi:hypothetical protein